MCDTRDTVFLMTALACDPTQLISLARSGNLDALDRLTRCQGDRLLQVGRRYCRTEEEAQDAVQDAMVSAATHMADFRGDGPIEGWVAQMVSRACGRMRRGRKNDASLHVVDVDLWSEDDSPEVLAGRSMVAEALGAALLEVPPVDRAILLLAEAEGFTGPEIAERLDMTPTNVRARLSRVRRRVRQRLEERLGEP